eukprot:COSAG01_NODE_44987_length_413_cov_8.372611_1_plen_58_part_00
MQLPRHGDPIRRAESLSLDLSTASEELACMAVEEGVEELWAEGGSSGHPHPPVRVGC